jgi:hypothetical protein
MTSKKLTAIEWLRQEYYNTDRNILMKDLFVKALAIEKEQIIASFEATYKLTRIAAEKYYKETYDN